LDPDRTRRFLEREIWPLVPPGEMGRRLTKEEEEEILGIGPEGY
jgi:antitoxin VapB